jgi:hypothetical protein
MYIKSHAVIKKKYNVFDMYHLTDKVNRNVNSLGTCTRLPNSAPLYNIVS